MFDLKFIKSFSGIHHSYNWWSINNIFPRIFHICCNPNNKIKYSRFISLRNSYFYHNISNFVLKSICSYPFLLNNKKKLLIFYLFLISMHHILLDAIEFVNFESMVKPSITFAHVEHEGKLVGRELDFTSKT